MTTSPQFRESPETIKRHLSEFDNSETKDGPPFDEIRFWSEMLPFTTKTTPTKRTKKVAAICKIRNLYFTTNLERTCAGRFANYAENPRLYAYGSEECT